MSITKSLEKAIRTMATQIAHDSPFDKTRNGVVVGYNANDNKYIITVDGVRYTDIPIVSGLVANINDVVRVMLPSGNVSQMFIYGVQATYTSLIGEIKPYAGSIEPTGWLICDGRAISRADYKPLFNVVGTTYGVGDGSTTFNIPDLSGRTLIGTSNDYPLADARGEATHKLTTNEIPSHTHGEKSLTGYFTSRKYGTQSGQQTFAGGIMTYDAGASTSAYGVAANSAQANMDVIRIDASHEHSSVGSGQVHNNMQPYLAINYLIYTGGVTF